MWTVLKPGLMGLAFVIWGLAVGAAPAVAQSPPDDIDPAVAALHASDKRVEELEALLEDFHARHPERTQLVTLGITDQGRPVLALVIGKALDAPHGQPSVLLHGGIHADEPMATEFVLDAIHVLLDNPEDDPRVEAWLDAMVVWCVPMLNPDGTALQWEYREEGRRRDVRKNARDLDGDGRLHWHEGVDLNRNFPFEWGGLGERGSKSKVKSWKYRGPAPASEAEIQALVTLAESEDFLASVAYHTGTTALLAPYTIAGVKDPVPNVPWMIGEAISEAMPDLPSGEDFELRRNLYPVDGTDQDYFFHQFGTVALLIEGGARKPKKVEDRVAVVEVVRESWTLLFDRLLEGPTLHGVVRDARGVPVQVGVQIGEHETFAGEQWSTRCRDGHYDLALEAAGDYTLEIVVPDKGVTRVPVHVSDGLTRLDVTLPFEVSASGMCASALPRDGVEVVSRTKVVDLDVVADASAMQTLRITGVGADAVAQPQVAPEGYGVVSGSGGLSAAARVSSIQPQRAMWLLVLSLGLGLLGSGYLVVRSISSRS